MNNTENNQEERVTMLSVDFDHVKNMYFVNLRKGSNVAETAFCMSIIIKCLLKDNIVDNVSVVLDSINKYLTDPQYEELTDDQVADDE